MDSTDVQPINERPFDVFLSHNSKDKSVVRRLARELQKRGIRVWLDEWLLVPGRPWQDALEDVIQNTRSAAVMIGANGLGPWEIPEMRTCISQFVSRGLPVIPVLLPTTNEQIELPPFLSQFTRVDFRGGITRDSLDRLEWGITGRKPSSIAVHEMPVEQGHSSRSRTPVIANYYTYLSAAKIEMLHAQIPEIERDQFGSATAPRTSGSDSLISKLNHVLASLRDSNQIAEPQSSLAGFIEASFPARCANYGWRTGELVMWVGDLIADTTQIRIAMGGSAHHLVGNIRPAEAVHSSSDTFAIEFALKQALGQNTASPEELERMGPALTDLIENFDELAQPFGRPCTGKEYSFTHGLAEAAYRMEASGTLVQNVHTVFRVLGRWHCDRVKEEKPGHRFSEQRLYMLRPEAHRMDLILGTPLYVALM